MFSLDLGLIKGINLGADALNVLRIFAAGLFVWVAGTLPLQHTLPSENVAEEENVSIRSCSVSTCLMVKPRSHPRSSLFQRITSPSGHGAPSPLLNLCLNSPRREHYTKQMCGRSRPIFYIAISLTNTFLIKLGMHSLFPHYYTN